MSSVAVEARSSWGIGFLYLASLEAFPHLLPRLDSALPLAEYVLPDPGPVILCFNYCLQDLHGFVELCDRLRRNSPQSKNGDF